MKNIGSVSLQVLRWSARVLSILAIGTVLMFAIGEGMGFPHDARDLVLGLFFPFGICLGMLVAWRWEGAGGALTVASLAAFYLANRLFSSSFPRGFGLLIFASPGFLFLACWLWKRAAINQH